MVKKRKELDKRDSKGRFKKGHKSTGGRKPGTIDDMLAPSGKKGDVRVLIDDLLTTYAQLGGAKFLTKWAKQNYKNLSRFVDILYKFAPEPRSFSPDEADHQPMRIVYYNDQVMLDRIGELESLLKKNKVTIPKSKKMEQLSENKPRLPEKQPLKTATELIEAKDSKEPKQLPEAKGEAKEKEPEPLTMTELLLEGQQQRGRKRKRRNSDDDSWVLTADSEDD